MKILLTSTPWESSSSVIKTSDNETHYPLGIAYLHSYLESKGHDVRTAWLNTRQVDYIQILLEYLTNFQPEIIGFNILTHNRSSTYQAIEYTHDKFPGIRIVIGGIHATIMYEQLLKKYPYVIAVLGEGELTFADLASAKPLQEIAGIAYYENEIIKNPDRELVDLDTLPFPKHDLFFGTGRTLGALLTSRGCPNLCSFCCLNPVSKHTVRYRSVGNVIAEIEYLVKSFPTLKTIWIHDDSFFLNNKRVIEICDELIKRKYPVSFFCSGRLKPVSEEMVLKLEQAGFTDVMFGLESGDPDVRFRCHKGITQEDAIKAVRLFSKTHIHIFMFLIVGLPGETDATIQTSARFIQKLQGIYYFYFGDIGVLGVYPGTEIYGLAKASGKIDDDYWLTDKNVPYYTVENSEQKLLEMKKNLLNAISVDRIKTFEGLKKQWYMIPSIGWWYVSRRLVILQNLLIKN
jgi:anaerobic magnesium-protoporphyrin IX monomethyl ester cyclase